MWLLNGLQPSKRTICRFKEDNKDALKNVFKSFNRFYRKIGLFGETGKGVVKTISLDSVKIKANNSKKKNHNKKTVEKTVQATDERINQYMTEIDKADQNEGYNEELALTSGEIKQIVDKLKARKEKYEELGKQIEETGETQISETDPDSRCMKQGGGKGMDVSYNTQVVTEETSKMIVDFKTTNNGSEKDERNNRQQW